MSVAVCPWQQSCRWRTPLVFAPACKHADPNCIVGATEGQGARPRCMAQGGGMGYVGLLRLQQTTHLPNACA